MALITPVIGVSLALPGCSALLLCARGPAIRPGGFAFLSRGSSHGLNWWPCSVRERAAGTNTGCGHTKTVVVRNKWEHKEDFAACIGGNCGLRASLGIHLVTKTAPAPIGTVLRLRPDKPRDLRQDGREEKEGIFVPTGIRTQQINNGLWEYQNEAAGCQLSSVRPGYSEDGASATRLPL
ncbi:hypothetical protein B0H17DRAFT_1142803 [Mycena rosella]|uniref:Uncharacterized protein n=1 Tax=Mycena rosella TaxID=1033263 RepID=A0AAD7CWH4_MYCRO|nr:hypothetical protein B0H17DRAFT_1142803 [Mycena rosella]